MAFVALATRYRWPGVLVALKPSIFPFALVGIRSRGWWIAAGVLALAALPFGFGMWSEWIAAMRNAQGGLLYSLGDVPLLCLPLVARMARTSRSRRS